MLNTHDKFDLALSLHQRGQWAQAKNLYEEVVRADPYHFDALHLLGVIAAQTNNPLEAVELIERALAVEPHDPGANFNLGTALQSLGRWDAALVAYDAAIVANGALVEAYSNRALVLKELKRLPEALASCDRAVTLDAGFAPAHFNRGVILYDLARRPEAIASYENAVAIDPGYAQAHFNRAVVLAELEQSEAALAGYEAAIACWPGYLAAHVNRGNLLKESQCYAAALASYDRALALNPNDALTCCNKGATLQALGRWDEALAFYDRSVAIDPLLAEAFMNRADLRREMQDFENAILDYERGLSLKSDFKFTDGLLLHSRLHVCDWEHLDAGIARIGVRIERGEPASNPFCLMSLSDDASLQKRSAQILVQSAYPPRNVLPPIAVRPAGTKLRLGYVSGDFRNHAVAHLMAGLIEMHDRERFDVIGFSLGPDTTDAMRKRIQRGFDRFIDVGNLTDLEAAQKIREEQIDVVIDLGGHTGGGRPGIFAHRAAPLQLSYLGYTGTTGAPYMDYVIADDTVIPYESREHYTEKVIYLPGSYMISDRARLISERTFTREEEGLPPGGFVFCSFNNSYKITPTVFDQWMRILTRVPESVLWLSQSNTAVPRRLCTEAVRRGVAAERLVFARRAQELADHLARHRLAGLFLDTLPFNAHTTASDALWSGLPVLTRPGESFASRVAASLVKAAGIPELVVSTPQAYEDLAVELATDAQRLQQITRRLRDARLDCALFDTRRTTRFLEAAYTKAYERQRAGHAPDHLHLAAH